MLKSLIRRIFYWGPRLCPACGRHARLRFAQVMWPELGEQWGLTPELYAWFDQREGVSCTLCGSSLRSRQLASAIVDQMNKKLGTNHSNLRALCTDPRAASLVVAEINSSGGAHPFLSLLPAVAYSEYGNHSSEVRSEDLLALSYADEMFDLVVTSDTLEHVPSFEGALSEVRRVLKPAGQHIFTVPVVWDRGSRIRATISQGKIVHQLPPSFHGAPGTNPEDFLVYSEFGGDIVGRIEAAGFAVSVFRDSRNPTLTTFVTQRR